MNFAKKEVIIIAGANGSGKTTFAHNLLKVIKYEFLNADEIAAQINPLHLNKVRLTAGKKFLLQINNFIKNNKSFIMETTFAGKYIDKVIKTLKKEKYIISIFFLFLESPDACKNRIKQRVLKGGHSVPEEDIVRRYYRGKINFWKNYRFKVNKWYLIDNSKNDFFEVCMGSNGEIITSNKISFQMFVKDI